jgi:hypothetical protein
LALEPVGGGVGIGTRRRCKADVAGLQEIRINVVNSDCRSAHKAHHAAGEQACIHRRDTANQQNVGIGNNVRSYLTAPDSGDITEG